MEEDKKGKIEECFIIMPIGDTEEYDKGHFTRVYEDIIQPAVKYAGYKPYRADDSKSSDLIHLDILKRIIEAPMAVCDLSSRNPNVLFELGIRQAFNKPVVLMKDNCTKRIFDVDLIRYTEYSRDLKYRDVINTQEALKTAIIETKQGNGINSIIKLLSINEAKPITLSGDDKQELALDIINAKIDSLHDYMKYMSTNVATLNTPFTVISDNNVVGSDWNEEYKQIQELMRILPTNSTEFRRLETRINRLKDSAITIPNLNKATELCLRYKEEIDKRSNHANRTR